MFERFTPNARQVVVLAAEKVRALGGEHIGTEHLLLGLFREQEGIAARALAALGVEYAAVREQVWERTGRPEPLGAIGQLPFTLRARNALVRASAEATALGHGLVGTEHVLLGLLREPEGAACRVLAVFGAPPEAVRAQVLGTLGGSQA